MARSPSRPVALVQYALFAAFALTLRCLPYWAAYRLLGMIAWLAARLLYVHKHGRAYLVARANLRAAFPERFAKASDATLDRFIRRSVRHLFYGFADGLLAQRLSARALGTYCKSQTDPAFAAYLDGRAPGRPGSPRVTAHFGSWELTSLHSAGVLGVPLVVLARPLDNAYVDRAVNRSRDRFGVVTITKFSTLPAVLRTLRGGRDVGFVADQDAGVPTRGIFVDFLGRRCKAIDATAALAIRLGVPLLPTFCVRQGEAFSFVVRSERPIVPRALPPGAPDYETRHREEVRRIVQAWHDALATLVRRHPAQYNWLHNKWRTRPLGEPGALPEHTDRQPRAAGMA